ncbi:hypothetical protein [Haloferula sargassicola]|uniref:Molecular chaperone DnaJ n=1 Tax=Haloferula sargassicola TaxID=490096 RepID=A0ABP9UND5_9BACT
MARPRQNELDLGFDPLPKPKPGLTLSPAAGTATLSPAQVEFNKRLKSLEKARTSHAKERDRLDKQLHLCRTELMPLVEKMNRISFRLVIVAESFSQSIKLTKRRKKWLGDLISRKAAECLADPVDLAEAELDELEALIETLGVSEFDKQQQAWEREEFGMLSGIIEEMARNAGVEIDLSSLDLNGDPAEFERQLEERFKAAGEDFQKKLESGELPPPPGQPKRKRKPTKAALERERRQQEIEQAKKRDIKTLYKQLAKVLHPDLEADPTLKAHKESWMKRLTSAHSGGDLREMLEIEMEWLGEEAGNLAKATDEKLRIYAMVLKEQAAETREHTRQLPYEPEYEILERFAGPFGDRIDPKREKLELIDETQRLQEMIDILEAGGAAARKMIHEWADHHARSRTGR